jgi:hypothetical protein
MKYQVQFKTGKGWEDTGLPKSDNENSALSASHQWSEGYAGADGAWPTTRVVPVEDQPKTNQ